MLPEFFTIVSGGEGGSFILPVIIAAACAVAAFYEESWTFDRKNRIITSKYGLLFLHSKKILSFAEVENIEFSCFLRGAESDGKADHEIELTRPFSRQNTGEAAGRGPRIIHPKYHQEIRLNLKSGDRLSIESLDSRTTETLSRKAGILSGFSGLKLIS